MISELNNRNIEISIMIFNVFQLSYRLEADIIGINDFPPLNRTRDDIANSNSKFWGYTENNKLAGVIEFEFKETQIEIESLVVSIEFFRRGIASSLINHVINLFPSLEIVVSTAAKNHPAVALYLQSGFTKESTWYTDCGISMISFRLSPQKNNTKENS